MLLVSDIPCLGRILEVHKKIYTYIQYRSRYIVYVHTCTVSYYIQYLQTFSVTKDYIFSSKFYK